jgi:hypothetical protein
MVVKKKEKKDKPKRLTRLTLLEQQLEFLKTHRGSKKEIADIEAKIARSKRAKRAKGRGTSYENIVKEKVNERFKKYKIDMARNPQSGGWKKDAENSTIRNDLGNYNENVKFLLSIECKNRQQWSLKDWWRQVKAECPTGNIPILAFHQQQVKERDEKTGKNKVTQKSEHYVMLYLEDFLDIIDDAKVIKKVVKKIKKIK